MRCASLVTLWKPTTAAAPLRVCALRRMSLSVGRSPGVRSRTTSDALTVRRCSSASSRKISSISGSMSSSAAGVLEAFVAEAEGLGPEVVGRPVERERLAERGGQRIGGLRRRGASAAATSAITISRCSISSSWPSTSAPLSGGSVPPTSANSSRMFSVPRANALSSSRPTIDAAPAMVCVSR